MVKNLPAMQEIRVQVLGGEETLKKGVATHSNTLAWRIPWTEEPGGLQSRGSRRVRHNRVTSAVTISDFCSYSFDGKLYVKCILSQ